MHSTAVLSQLFEYYRHHWPFVSYRACGGQSRSRETLTDYPFSLNIVSRDTCVDNEALIINARANYY